MVRTAAIAFFLSSLAPSAPSSSGSSFNLICTGSDSAGLTIGGNITNFKQKDFVEVYRVDLLRSRWCRDECAETKPVAGISDTEITFEKSSDEILGGKNISVNRESGNYVGVTKVGDYTSVKIGACKRATFTGFPVRKF